jgi:DNA helicase-2/ATP-dependent DNA helicase PcrA
MSLKLNKVSANNLGNISNFENLENQSKPLFSKYTPEELEKKLASLTTHLNDKQKEAVTHLNGPMLIVAGAGSGKTGVLTHRIAYMVLKGVKPWNILALTFTNKAAKEMIHRISKLVSEEDAHKIWAGTFHSVFAKILRFEAEHIGYTSNFTIYDTEDSLSSIKSVMNSFGISQQLNNPQKIRSAISSAKNKMISPEEFTNTAFNGDQKQIGFIYNEYEKYLQKSNAMDFDDILLNFIRLLEKNKEILKKYQEKFRYLLVDEYQDTNKAQYIAISLLSKAHQNLCVVGDDAQSIYGWRGADIANILHFQKDYPYCKIVRLEQNYRSTQIILDAADSVIKHNPKRIDKKLWTENTSGNKINIISTDDEKDEATKVANVITQLYKSGAKLGDIAILYRTNAQALFIENALRKNNYNYVVFGGISFFKRKEIKDVVSYLRLLVNPNDNESLLRIINEPPRGLGKTSLDHLIAYSNNRNISLFQSFKEASLNNSLQGRAVVAADNFVKFVENYSNDETLNSYELLSEFIENSGLFDMYKEIDTEDSMDRLNNIEQFIADVQIFFDTNEGLNITDYLQQVALITDMDEKDSTKEHISVMTLHSAKGLEFENVIITGLEQGLFPSQRANSENDEIEEERRLFYVGITRAKSHLYLTYSKKRLRFGEYQFQMPSQFLKEINSDLVIWPNAQREMNSSAGNFANKGFSKFKSNNFSSGSSYSGGSFKENYSQVNNDSNYSQVNTYNEYSQVSPSNSYGEFKVGEKVSHHSFGRGVVTGLTGIGEHKKVYIRFDLHGKKTLMLKYAKLTKLG